MNTRQMVKGKDQYEWISTRFVYVLQEAENEETPLNKEKKSQR